MKAEITVSHTARTIMAICSFLIRIPAVWDLFQFYYGTPRQIKMSFGEKGLNQNEDDRVLPDGSATGIPFFKTEQSRVSVRRSVHTYQLP